MTYKQKLEQLYRRKNNLSTYDTITLSSRVLAESNKALRYILASMEEVEQKYRDNTIKAGEKVYNHLSNLNCDFRFQGSILTKIEIKQHSDIDLVVITKIASSLERGLPNPYPYSGCLTNDLRNLRTSCEQKLRTIYNEVNIRGAKSIEVHLTNPRRKVDVVVANWYETYDWNNSYLSNKEYLKGIYLYDKQDNKRIGPDFPFLRAYNINNHNYSNEIKKLVRFMKNLREDFDIGKLNSFTINCIAYNISYNDSSNELNLVKQLYNVLPSQGYYDKFTSPCGKEKVRVDYNSKLNAVLKKLIQDAENNSYYE